MKTEQELKAMLGEGFTVEKVKIVTETKLTGEYHMDCFIVTEKKDPWDGVEFGRYKFPNPGQFSSFKVKSISEQMLTTEGGSELFKGNCEPITEPVYIEQLKRRIMSRFDNALASDEIDDSNMDGGRLAFSFMEADGNFFLYRKDTDTLYWAGIPVYQAGKWATKLPKRVEVEVHRNGYCFDHKLDKCMYYNPNFRVTGITEGAFPIDELNQFLASQLEAFLNGEIGKEEGND